MRICSEDSLLQRNCNIGAGEPVPAGETLQLKVSHGFWHDSSLSAGYFRYKQEVEEIDCRVYGEYPPFWKVLRIIWLLVTSLKSERILGMCCGRHVTLLCVAENCGFFESSLILKVVSRLPFCSQDP